MSGGEVRDQQAAASRREGANHQVQRNLGVRNGNVRAHPPVARRSGIPTNPQ